MVSWPWSRSDDAASFEKTLSQLADKISKTSSKNDRLRQQARRVNLVWMLYAGFAYIVAAIFLTLVSGMQSWGPAEYTAMAGGPVMIYAIRRGLSAFYSYRISSTQSSLDHFYSERDKTIEKLKTATKYNSTQQLLEKYGDQKPSPSRDSRENTPKRRKQQPQTPQPRTGMPPPPTANIPRGPPNLPPGSPPPQPGMSPTGQMGGGPSPPPTTAEFAPNAYSHSSPPPPSNMQAAEPLHYEHKWYDRLMDVLLGDDETQARNRIVLLCSNCRLINGMAPPGASRIEDVGRWRCRECGAWNGVEDQQAKMVEKIVKESKADHSVKRGMKDEEPESPVSPVSPVSTGGEGESGLEAEITPEGSDEDVVMEDVPPSRATRSRRKGK